MKKLRLSTDGLWAIDDNGEMRYPYYTDGCEFDKDSSIVLPEQYMDSMTTNGHIIANDGNTYYGIVDYCVLERNNDKPIVAMLMKPLKKLSH